MSGRMIDEEKEGGKEGKEGMGRVGWGDDGRNGDGEE